MINFKKYKRFFAFGCSMTKYYWPTWADIIAKEIPESYNYGQSGGGNLFIANQITEANIRYKFDSGDLVVVMWTGISREDRWLNGQWLTPGNIYTQNYYDENFIKKFTDSKGYLIRDLSLITMCKGYLDSLGIDYYMLNMAPFESMQYATYEKTFNNSREVLNFYHNTLSCIKPDILTIEYNGVWPQHPIKGRGKGQTADYHPDTQGHANYLQKVFPELEFSKETLDFINIQQCRIFQAEYLDELDWNPIMPQRL